jgi:hypothetical protein
VRTGHLVTEAFQARKEPVERQGEMVSMVSLVMQEKRANLGRKEILVDQDSQVRGGLLVLLVREDQSEA